MKLSSPSSKSEVRLSMGQVTLVIFGVVAPLLTFMLAVSGFPDYVKIFILVFLAFGYAVVCLWTFRKSRGEVVASEIVDNVDHDLDAALLAIGEANEFFGASLKPADMFRLVSSRVAQIYPFASSALFVRSESGDALEIVQADGANASAIVDVVLPLERGLAGMAWLSREVEIDSDLKLESFAMPDGALSGLGSAVAIPLVNDDQPFAVLVLYRKENLEFDPAMNSILEAIGQRVAPVFLSSMSLERTISNALTDTLTSLPNERAFFMVLENQLAESHRFRTERPLTVMSVDIKNFNDVNQNFGFAAGDRMLTFAAEHLASQLRKMDFLSRSVNDEFLIILPTASVQFAGEILDRIKNHFAAQVFAVSETEEVKVWLNVGMATFWQDGETAAQLLQHARVKKQQSKAEEPSKVLWFPKEYVN